MKRTLFVLFLIFFMFGLVVMHDNKKRADHTASASNQSGITTGQSAGSLNSSGEQKQVSTVEAPKTGFEDITVESTKDEAADSGKEGIVDQVSIDQVMNSSTGLYCYDTMDASLHQLYAELYVVCMQHEENIRVSTTDSDQLEYAFKCMYNDHPEIYWVDGYTYTRHTQGSKILYLTFSGKYTYTANECAQYNQQINGYLSRFLGGISMSASDYDKVKYTYEFLINNTDYVIGSRDNQNILSVMLYGDSVCQGYAKSTQYLLGKLGVKSTMVVGVVGNGEGHAWNLVNIDGAYYYVDTTWGDSSYLGSADGNVNANTVNYNFLNITTDELTKTHSIDNVVPMPYCLETKDNYYVHEGLYITGYDETTFRNIFDSARANGKDFVTFKCMDANVYSEVYNRLIGDQEIFNYLSGGSDNVSYVNSDDTYVFTFWL